MSVKLVTLSFGKRLDRRRTSLCIQGKRKKFTKFMNPPKIFLCLVVFLLSKTPKGNQPDSLKMLQKQEFFTLDSLLTWENLGEVQTRQYFSLYVLSKTKQTSHSAFFFLFLLISGDVNPNPGPGIQNPCSSCLKSVAKTSRFVLCTECGLRAHIKCENISPKRYLEMKNHPSKLLSFICSTCHLNELPFPEGFTHDDSFNIQVMPTQNDDQIIGDDLKGISKTRGLKLAHLNTNGILSKIDYLRIMLHETKFDIFAVSESKLDANIHDNEIKIDGYDLYRLDRNRHGGGVLVFVNEDIESHPLKHLTNSKHESLWLKVSLKKTKPIFFAVVYRPPSKSSDLDNTDQLCTYLEQCVQKLPQQNEVFICGDFNCNMLTKNALASKINTVCSSLSFKQLIEEPTRVTPHSSTLLDLFLTNSQNISKTGVFDCGISDHSMIYVVRKLNRPKLKPKTLKIRSYKNFVEEDFLTDLRNADWSYFLNFEDLDEACGVLNSIVNSVAEKHAPMISIKIKGNTEAWVTPEFLAAIKERDFLKKRASKSKTITDWQIFKLKRNQVTRMKNKLKQEYFNSLLAEQSKRPKDLWKTLKQLVPGKNTKSTGIKRLVSDGEDITCPKGIADHFNEFFVNVGVQLASKFSSDTTKINPPVSDKLFNFSFIQTRDVERHISALKNGKATGLDGIGSRILKAGSPVISIYLAKLFNLSLEIGYVPKCWKMKRVSPIHKGDSKTDPNNFRPISILPIPMKIFEKIVHDQVSDFIKDNKFLGDRQSGFRKLFSTTTAVLDVSDKILEELDNKKYVGAVLIDLKKAFDTVDHKILLKKLWCYGLQDQSFDWFSSYLTDRQQLTLINNTESDLLHEDVYGVPQGSVLGPLLFLLYINDLKSVIENCYCHLYADDTILINSASDPDVLIENLERELVNVDQWLSINKMTINTKKTEVIFFGTESKLKKLDSKTVRYLGTPLERKAKVKYLGVIFDQKMQWDNQIKNIAIKTNLKLAKIKSVASVLTDHTKKLLVNALVMPYFHYCSPAWSSARPFRLRKLNKIVVAASNFLGRKEDYTLKDLLDKDLSILTYKVLHEIAPEYMCSKLQMTKNSHTYNTRRASTNQLQIPSANKNFGQMTFTYRAAKLWSGLPLHLLDTWSLLRFKTSANDFFGKL